MSDPNAQVSTHGPQAYAAVHTDRNARTRRPQLPTVPQRQRLAARLRRVADRLDG